MNSHRTFVIAEMASTHDGDARKALEMVRMAAKAGADAVKAQFWSSAQRMAQRRKTGAKYLEIYRLYQIPEDWLELLEHECSRFGVEFMCTAFLPEDIETVAWHIKRFKVSSFEASDHPFLWAHGNRPVILSTGMMAMHQVEDSVRALQRPQAVLHCVSSYPCGPVDLDVLRSMRNVLDVPVGLSDHTANNLTGALAVAAGADYLEVHFRHPMTDFRNPDYDVAVPDLKEYVRLVRIADQYRGSGVKQPLESESEMAMFRVEHRA